MLNKLLFIKIQPEYVRMKKLLHHSEIRPKENIIVVPDDTSFSRGTVQPDTND